MVIDSMSHKFSQSNRFCCSEENSEMNISSHKAIE